MTILLAALLVAAAPTVQGHGYLAEPPSRMLLAYANTGAGGAPGDYCPHCVRSDDAYAQCEGPDGSVDCLERDFPGANPWSEPGSFDGIGFPTENGPMGVCGASRTSANNYNQPSPFGIFGAVPTQEYAPGQVIDVAWCVAADHGGVPMFRLCNDQSLVDKLLDANRAPTVAELEALETCFQEGLLRCDAVPDNTCPRVPLCQLNPSWEACAEGKYNHCTGADGLGIDCVNTQEICAHGTLARYRLKIPEDTPASEHTILSFRWDTYLNNEVYPGCADIKITGTGQPVVAPTGPSPAPSTAEPSAKPSANPTEPAALTANPTEPPVEPPFEPPTNDPEVCYAVVPCPTVEPTADPTTPAACEDSSSWRYNEIESRDCQWVRGRPAVRCAKGDAMDECPVACDACDDGFSPTAEPTETDTFEPTAKPTGPTPATPTAEPVATPPADGFCCYYTPSGDACQCMSRAVEFVFCGGTRTQCETCGAKWCGTP
mmetsp:Transcript_2740/g.8080  ORF Transcript_2740/g.8080 Transcript_2740/m.8080 type:complete len:488 (-) Transcript_2740:145-1608(-)